MREFFHGWPRKTGCVTLLMAIALCGEWCRTQTRVEVVERVASEWLFSGRGTIIWATESNTQASRVSFMFSWYESLMERLGKHPDSTETQCDTLEVDWDCLWRHGCAGFEVGRHQCVQYKTCTVRWCRIEFSSLVGLLTLLSAYLILWQPRKQQPAASKPHA